MKEKDKLEQVLTLFSFEGGTGKTMLALNMAKLFVKEKKKTLVLELDIYNPSLQLMLEIKPKRYITDHLLERKREDDLNTLKECLFGDCIVTHETGIDFALAEPPSSLEDINNRNNSLNAERFLDFLMGVIVELKTKYEIIIIDAPSTLNVVSLHAILVADRPILVSLPDLRKIDGRSELIRKFPEYIQIKPIDVMINNMSKNYINGDELREKIKSMLNFFAIRKITFLERCETYFKEVTTSKRLFLHPEKSYALYCMIANYVSSYKEEKEEVIAL